MESLLVSTVVVALAEIGDKTQLLALVLATRFRRPVPIILGILVATLANHAGAAAVGSWVSQWLGADRMRWILGASFVAMGAWTLVPDRSDTDDRARTRRLGVFATTLIAFFLVEMGDKTQIATVALAARFDSVVLVTAGTTLGMMLANVPVVWLGDAAATRIPLRPIRWAAAALFVVLGLLALLDVAPA